MDPVLLEPETRPASRLDLHRAGYSEGVGLPWTACMGSRPRQHGREGQSDCCNAHIIPRSRSLLGVTSCSRSHYKRRGAKLASLEGAYRCTKTYQGASVPVHQFKFDFRVTSNAANWSAIGSLAASWFARGSEKDIKLYRKANTVSPATCELANGRRRKGACPAAANRDQGQIPRARRDLELHGQSGHDLRFI